MAANLPELNASKDRKVEVQRTTFTYDVVSRFICNTLDEVEAQSRAGGRPFDVIVVGSGMYGAYAASKLFDLGRKQSARTLVLEAGPFLITEHIQNLARVGFGVADAVLERHWLSNMGDGYSPHHVCVGGKSAFWGGWSPRFKDDDLVRWPSDVADFLRTHYSFLEEETGVEPDTDFIKGPLNDALATRTAAVITAGVANLTVHWKPPIAVQGDAPGSGLFSFDKYSSLPVLIDAIRDAAAENDTQRRLFLVPRTRVIRLETERAVVKSVTVWSDGEVRTIDVSPTTIVLLAAQSINSTRIALESFPTTGVRATERIGRNMMAHLRGNFTVRIKREAFGLKPTRESDPLQVGARQVDGKTADGRFHFQTYAATNVDSRKGAEEFLYRMIPNLDDLQRILASQDAEWVTVTIRTVSEMEDSRDIPIGDSSRSWIDLSPNSRDVFGSTSVPSAFVNLVTTAKDERLWAATEKAAFDFVLALAEGKPENIEYLLRNGTWTGERPVKLSDFRDGLGTTYHECGTLWMGQDPAASVTDVGGRFHHVANAGCTDQGLFPTSGSANPALTGLTLTRKVVQDLLARLDTTDVPVADKDAEFKPLFAGTLEPDWQKADVPNFNVFQGPDGVPLIEAGLSGAESALGVLWYTQQEFEDFILRLEWKTFSIDANAGVFIRAPRPQPPLFDSAFYDAATEVQIDERGKDFQVGRNPQTVYGSSLHKTGAIYGIATATRWAARVPRPRFGDRDGGWNLFEITARGRSIEVRLNNHLVSRSDLLPAAKLSRGFIGLQCHTDLAQFRNIRLKALG